MSDNRSPPDDDANSDEIDDIEASLNDALNDLERMLERQDRPVRESDDDGYDIPLLDEVVIPGPGVAEVDAATVPAMGDNFLEDDEPALRRRLAARLASEVEVIVGDRIEQAIELAKDEIREQVRNHLDIILPEIVEEILQQRNRRHP